MADDKATQILNNYLNHTQKYILDHKKDFSSINGIYRRFIKKDKIDPAFEYTKEVIKRMEKDKISPQLSMQMVDILTPYIHGLKKEVIKMAVPFLLGFIMLITFTLLFSFTRPLSLSNPFFIFYAIGMLISVVIFGFGYYLRKKVKLSTISKTIIFQAANAYSAAKMQGQGSFGALRILDEMKHKQGKEMQIRIMQPKIVHKR